MSTIITNCFVMVMLGLFMANPVVASSPIMPLKEQNMLLSISTPKGAIEYYADYYNAPKEQLLKVSFCESSYNPKAIGDHGSARNIFQYHFQTFQRHAKLLGENLDYNSYQDQAKLASFIFANYPQEKRAWTCYK